MTKLPRYVQPRKQPKGVVSYRFNPPQSLVDAGVVQRKESVSYTHLRAHETQ